MLHRKFSHHLCLELCQTSCRGNLPHVPTRYSAESVHFLHEFCDNMPVQQVFVLSVLLLYAKWHQEKYLLCLYHEVQEWKLLFAIHPSGANCSALFSRNQLRLAGFFFLLSAVRKID